MSREGDVRDGENIDVEEEIRNISERGSLRVDEARRGEAGRGEVRRGEAMRCEARRGDSTRLDSTRRR